MDVHYACGNVMGIVMKQRMAVVDQLALQPKQQQYISLYCKIG